MKKLIVALIFLAIVCPVQAEEDIFIPPPIEQCSIKITYHLNCASIYLGLANLHATNYLMTYDPEDITLAEEYVDRANEYYDWAKEYYSMIDFSAILDLREKEPIDTLGIAIDRAAKRLESIRMTLE